MAIDVVEGQRRKLVIGGRGPAPEYAFRDLTGSIVLIESTTPRVEVRTLEGFRVTEGIASSQPFLQVYLVGLLGSGQTEGELRISLQGPNVAATAPTVLPLHVVEVPGAPDPEDVVSVGLTTRQTEPLPTGWAR